MIDALNNKGFIALISVIIIVLILLGTTAALATSGFLNRFNILDGEAKEKSAGFVAACVESARIKIARDAAYSGGETLKVGDGDCTIVSVTSGVIHATSTYKEAHTNYEVTVNTGIPEIPITGWTECTTLAEC